MQKPRKTPGPLTELCPVCGRMRTPNHPTAELPAHGYVRQKWIVAYLGISKSKLWRDCRDGTFPKPHKIAPRVTGWRVEDVRKWMIDNGLLRSAP